LILSPPNLPDWDKFPIIEILEDKLGAPAVLDNDANASALGEFKYGAGRGINNLVYMTISTGIGGGVIVRGKLVHGVCDGAGEVGHTTILPDGPLCGCGARGCLEALCSGTSIARRTRERLVVGASSSLTALPLNLVTAHAVADAARAGDPLGVEIWDETIHYLAIGIGNVLNTLAPEAIILGGGVSTAGDQLLEPLRAQVRERVTILPPEKINILQAELGGDSGIYGALILGQNVVSG
jgi:glucokinase